MTYQEIYVHLGCFVRVEIGLDSSVISLFIPPLLKGYHLQGMTYFLLPG